MNSRTMRITTGIVSANLVFAGLAYFLYAQHATANTITPLLSSFNNMPEYRIIERRMDDDRAVVSLAMDRPTPEKAKKVAKFIIETSLSANQTSAHFFVYREGKNLRKDEPDHEVDWVYQHGLNLDY